MNIYLVEESTGFGYGDINYRIIKVFLTKEKATNFINECESLNTQMLNSKCPIDKPEDQMSDTELYIVEQWENELCELQYNNPLYGVIEMEVDK
jgi:hypothetical protein